MYSYSRGVVGWSTAFINTEERFVAGDSFGIVALHATDYVRADTKVIPCRFFG